MSFDVTLTSWEEEETEEEEILHGLVAKHCKHAHVRICGRTFRPIKPERLKFSTCLNNQFHSGTPISQTRL